MAGRQGFVISFGDLLSQFDVLQYIASVSEEEESFLDFLVRN